jgi:hypothetical protein
MASLQQTKKADHRDSPFPPECQFGTIRLAVEQLCFFKFPRPLLERFGKEFFGAVPRAPGVYVFSGENGRALYVGHSKNLRLRLSYYKNAQPEREPRRIVRLVHQVQKIDFECCDSVNGAQVRELALIRQLRPRFNVANTLSPTFSFFALRDAAPHFAVRLSMSQAKQDGEEVVGGFRNRGLCARAFLAIARTIFATENTVASIYDFPARLNIRSREWKLDVQWRAQLEPFLRGEEMLFLDRATELVSKETDPFLRQIFETDMLMLAEFGELAREMSELRAMRESCILSQEALQVGSKLMQNRLPEPLSTQGSETVLC